MERSRRGRIVKRKYPEDEEEEDDEQLNSEGEPSGSMDNADTDSQNTHPQSGDPQTEDYDDDQNPHGTGARQNQRGQSHQRGAQGQRPRKKVQNLRQLEETIEQLQEEVYVLNEQLDDARDEYGHLLLHNMALRKRYADTEENRKAPASQRVKPPRLSGAAVQQSDIGDSLRQQPTSTRGTSNAPSAVAEAQPIQNMWGELQGGGSLPPQPGQTVADYQDQWRFSGALVALDVPVARLAGVPGGSVSGSGSGSVQPGSTSSGRRGLHQLGGGSSSSGTELSAAGKSQLVGPSSGQLGSSAPASGSGHQGSGSMAGVDHTGAQQWQGTGIVPLLLQSSGKDYSLLQTSAPAETANLLSGTISPLDLGLAERTQRIANVLLGPTSTDINLASDTMQLPASRQQGPRLRVIPALAAAASASAPELQDVGRLTAQQQDFSFGLQPQYPSSLGTVRLGQVSGLQSMGGHQALGHGWDQQQLTRDNSMQQAALLLAGPRQQQSQQLQGQAAVNLLSSPQQQQQSGVKPEPNLYDR